MSDDDVVVPAQEAVSVFTNTRGDIVISQHRWPDEDPYICIRPENIRALAQALMVEAGLLDVEPGQEVVAPAKDRTAAQRQQRYRNKHRNDGVLPFREAAE